MRRAAATSRIDDLVRPRRWLNAAFFVLVAVMVLHQAEHVAQVVQKDAIGAACPRDCRGFLGFAFDLEWVHFAYNVGTFLALGALYAAYRLWERPWRQASPIGWALLTGGIAVQGYHAVEHASKLEQWFASGRHSPTPGVLGQLLPPADGRNFSLVELHFLFNTSVFMCTVAGYVSFRFHRHIWPREPFRTVVPAVGLGGALVATVGIAWAAQPPTVRLSAGVHKGPLVLDRAQKLIGEPSAVVQGGIRIRANDVTVRDVRVVGGEYGVSVENARRVLLDRVTISGAELDGINTRRASVFIRDCAIGSLRSRYAQGIDISFSFDLEPSIVEECRVDGGYEGIVTHFARAHVRDNIVRDTTLRAITLTEMSMATAERNDVRDALGVGIFCGDYSMCTVRDNRVRGVRPDHESGEGTRMGFGILAHFGAKAKLDGNTLEAAPGGAAALSDAKLAYD